MSDRKRNLEDWEVLAVAPNLDWETLYQLHNLTGRAVVLVAVNRSEELWRHPDLSNLLKEKLLDAAFGAHDSTLWSDPILAFYHVKSEVVINAMQLIRNRLSALGLLQFCTICVGDHDSLTWRKFHVANETKTPK